MFFNVLIYLLNQSLIHRNVCVIKIYLPITKNNSGKNWFYETIKIYNI